jgi:hypothetical protein
VELLRFIFGDDDGGAARYREGMHVMFEVYLGPGASAEALLTPETLQDTQAQIMTPEEAAALGLQGIPEDPEGRERRFIVVVKSDERRIYNQLEMNPQVTAFRLHEIDL